MNGLMSIDVEKATDTIVVKGSVFHFVLFSLQFVNQVVYIY